MIVDRKTDVDAGSVTVTSSRILNDTEYAKETNILHRYRSFNYLFTLAAAPEEALTNPDSVRDSSNFIVIAKSGGKGQPLPVELGTSMSYEVQDTVEGYNNRSPGRFDMFIDNVEIETVMGFSQGTNLSMATKMNFEVFEPFSMNGFLESLQVSALAAGHKSYMGAPYMFKIEYIGYLTNDKVHRLGKEGTRTFIININKVEIEVNENGTKYRCQAVTYNDLAYGDNMALKTSFQMLGTTVGEVLTSLMQNLNEAASESNQEDNKDNNQYDEYEIIFPSREGNKFDYDKPNKISEAKIIELREDTKVYSFPDHSILKENADQQNTAENNKSRGVEMRYNPGSYDPKTDRKSVV